MYFADRLLQRGKALLGEVDRVLRLERRRAAQPALRSGWPNFVVAPPSHEDALAHVLCQSGVFGPSRKKKKNALVSSFSEFSFSNPVEKRKFARMRPARLLALVGARKKATTAAGHVTRGNKTRALSRGTQKKKSTKKEINDAEDATE